MLSNEQRAMDSALILFCLKDKDLFGISNQYIAECYLSFKDIQEASSNNEQIHLKLNRPRNTGEKCIEWCCINDI